MALRVIIRYHNKKFSACGRIIKTRGTAEENGTTKPEEKPTAIQEQIPL